MKKLLIALVSLLVCSLAFAGTSVTAGAGFGTNTTIGDGGLSTLAPIGFVSVDHEFYDYFSVYGDFAFSYVIGRCDKNGYHPLSEDQNCYVFSLDAGCGHTFNFENASVMIGGGLNIIYQLLKMKVDSNTTITKALYPGFNLRLKGTYQFNETWGISATVSSAVYPCVTIIGKATKPQSGITCNALIGATYKF